MKVGYVKRYGEWRNIYNFLESDKKHIEIFAEKYNLTIEDVEKMLKGCDERILDLIDSDTDEIQNILDAIFEDDEKKFIIAQYNEKDDTITADVWEVK